MAISDELSRLITAKAGIKSALEEKGLTIDDSSTLDEYPALIEEMQIGGGIDTSLLIDMIEGDLTSIVIPEGVNKIGRNAFYNRLLLSSVQIPVDVSNIGIGAFAGCGSLRDIDLPEACTIISNGLFRECGSLAKFVVKNGVTEIGERAFENVSTGISMAMLPTTPPILKENGKYVFGNSTMTWPIYVKNSVVDTYKNAGGNWNDISTRIEPLVSMTYDASTYTVTASGRDNVELYVDSSLINSSVYTFEQEADDSSHIIEVKSVDPSVGELDSSITEVLIPARPAPKTNTLKLITDASTNPELYQDLGGGEYALPELIVGQQYTCSFTFTANKTGTDYKLIGKVIITTDLSDVGKNLDENNENSTLTGNHYYISRILNLNSGYEFRAQLIDNFNFTATNANTLYAYAVLAQGEDEREREFTKIPMTVTPI